MSNSGVLWVVATPIGNLDDISQRAVQVLGQVAGIYAEDTRHTRRLLSHLGLDTPLRSLHEHNERGRIDEVAARLAAGESLALVSDAGTPLISDPGFPLVRALREQGHAVRPVPGASALVAAMSVSGLPCDRFRFEGFLPAKAAARRKALQALAGESATLVFYESSHRIADMLADLVEVLGADRPGCVARELTKHFETVLTDSLAALHERVKADPDQRRGEFVVLVAGRSIEPGCDALSVDEDRLLQLLAGEMPPARAVKLAVEITGRPRRALYQRLQELHDR